MNIQQLTYIVEIAKCKSISRASEYLFVSQPALSQQIRNLEKELGYRVFRRTSKGLEHSVEDRLLRKTYGEQNITWKRVIRSDSIDTVMKMVKSGSGIAIGPQSFAEYYGVTAVPLVPARQDSLYFACLKSKKKEPEIRDFQRYLTTLVSSACPD